MIWDYNTLIESFYSTKSFYDTFIHNLVIEPAYAMSRICRKADVKLLMNYMPYENMNITMKNNTILIENHNSKGSYTITMDVRSAYNTEITSTVTYNNHMEIEYK